MQREVEEKKEAAKEVQENIEAEENEVVGADMGQIEAGRGDFHNLVDILFVLDTTGSMGWCIKECKKTIKKIIKKFADKQYNIKFALELYRDHPPQEYSYVEKHYDLRNQEDIIKVLDKDCDAAGGGDTPEAVMDGLFQGLKKTSWRIGTDGTTKSKRFLFHCCDAPPHGKQYGSSSTDKTWQEKGCPCGISKLDIQGLLVENKVDYSLIKVGNSIDLMESLFKECFLERFKKVMPLEVKSGGSGKHKKSKKDKKEKIQVKEQKVYRFTDTREDECSREPRRQIKKKKIPIKYSESGSDEDLEECQLERCDSRRRESFDSGSASASSSSEDEASKAEAKAKGIVRKRSMASLVCSQVESGLSDYEKQLDLKKAE